jgi:putative RNA 2'-phosphotransferase
MVSASFCFLERWDEQPLESLMTELDPALARIGRSIVRALRHAPEEEGLVLDEQGWTDVGAVRRAFGKAGRPLSHQQLQALVAADSKQRLELSPDGQRMRAAQGHSIEVDLSAHRAEPPELLFHGTSTDRLESIRAEGLHAGQRQHVHLSPDVDTAVKVGRRHGRAVVLIILAGELARAGQVFMLASNGVWLTGPVRPEAIDWSRLIFPGDRP